MAQVSWHVHTRVPGSSSGFHGKSRVPHARLLARIHAPSSVSGTCAPLILFSVRGGYKTRYRVTFSYLVENRFFTKKEHACDFHVQLCTEFESLRLRTMG